MGTPSSVIASATSRDERAEQAQRQTLLSADRQASLTVAAERAAVLQVTEVLLNATAI
jgi:hypothetical protein